MVIYADVYLYVSDVYKFIECYTRMNILNYILKLQINYITKGKLI